MMFCPYSDQDKLYHMYSLINHLIYFLFLSKKNITLIAFQNTRGKFFETIQT